RARSHDQRGAGRPLRRDRPARGTAPGDAGGGAPLARARAGAGPTAAGGQRVAMRIVVANHRLAEVGGTETYLGTLAEHLQELGHEVTVFSPAVGEWGRELERRGLM